MNYIFLAIYLPVCSFGVANPKLCVNCRFFITDYGNGKFGKCSLFPVKDYDDDFLVNGIAEKKPLRYNFCSTARSYDNMCGKEGKLHKRKYKKCEFTPLDM